MRILSIRREPGTELGGKPTQRVAYEIDFGGKTDTVQILVATGGTGLLSQAEREIQLLGSALGLLENEIRVALKYYQRNLDVAQPTNIEEKLHRELEDSKERLQAIPLLQEQLRESREEIVNLKYDLVEARNNLRHEQQKVRKLREKNCELTRERDKLADSHKGTQELLAAHLEVLNVAMDLLENGGCLPLTRDGLRGWWNYELNLQLRKDAETGDDPGDKT